MPTVTDRLYMILVEEFGDEITLAEATERIRAFLRKEVK